MARDERLIQLAIKVAEKSQHQFRLGVVVALGSRIMALGINKYRTHPRQMNWRTNDFANSVHAELDAILSCPYIEGATIYVARILRNGDVSMAKPCKICQKIIKSAGIKRVVYQNGYRDDSGIKFLEKAGIEIVHIPVLENQ